MGGLGEKHKRIKKYKLAGKNSHGVVKYSIENIVDNIITIYGVRGHLKT